MGNSELLTCGYVVVMMGSQEDNWRISGTAACCALFWYWLAPLEAGGEVKGFRAVVGWRA